MNEEKKTVSAVRLLLSYYLQNKREKKRTKTK